MLRIKYIVYRIIYYYLYQGVLMIAMATDANQKVLPFAFAIVDKESGPSWGWFLECLRTSIERVIPNLGHLHYF